MIISQEKRNKNIAEYILYMWQIEDQIRGFDFDINKIQNTIISQYQTDEDTKKQITAWYEDIISMMELERIQKKGHLQILQNIVNEMNRIHLQLLKTPGEMQYQETFMKINPHLQDLKSKITKDEINDIEACLHALYGILLLRISKKTISKETDVVIREISTLISILAKKFHQYEIEEKENLEVF